MPQLPPWLNVDPKDFVSAAERGASIGTQISSIATQAQEQDRNRQAAAETAAANRSLQQWEAQQRAQQAAAALASQDKHTMAQLDATSAYQMGNLGVRQGMLDEAQKRDEMRHEYSMSRLKQPIVRTLAGGGLATVDPTTGEMNLLRDPATQGRMGDREKIILQSQLSNAQRERIALKTELAKGVSPKTKAATEARVKELDAIIERLVRGDAQGGGAPAAVKYIRDADGNLVAQPAADAGTNAPPAAPAAPAGAGFTAPVDASMLPLSTYGNTIGQ